MEPLRRRGAAPECGAYSGAALAFNRGALASHSTHVSTSGELHHDRLSKLGENSRVATESKDVAARAAPNACNPLLRRSISSSALLYCRRPRSSMLFLDLTSELDEIFGQFGYLAPFTLLLLCGIGFPLPEEAALIGAGILLHRGQVTFVRVTLVCAAAILIGDSLPYWLGRRYGMRALEIPWVGRFLHPERFQRFRKRFEEHGNWTTFVCRFLAGVRIPGYFIAGAMGMRYGRFLFLDLLGILLTVPASIYLGKLFGGQIERLKETVHDLHLILAFLVLVLALVLVFWTRRTRAAARAAANALEGRGGDPTQGP